MTRCDRWLASSLSWRISEIAGAPTSEAAFSQRSRNSCHVRAQLRRVSAEARVVGPVEGQLGLGPRPADESGGERGLKDEERRFDGGDERGEVGAQDLVGRDPQAVDGERAGGRGVERQETGDLASGDAGCRERRPDDDAAAVGRTRREHQDRLLDQVADPGHAAMEDHVVTVPGGLDAEVAQTGEGLQRLGHAGGADGVGRAKAGEGLVGRCGAATTGQVVLHDAVRPGAERGRHALLGQRRDGRRGAPDVEAARRTREEVVDALVEKAGRREGFQVGYGRGVAGVDGGRRRRDAAQDVVQGAGRHRTTAGNGESTWRRSIGVLTASRARSMAASSGPS